MKLAYFGGKVVDTYNGDGTTVDETVEGFWSIVNGYTKHTEESERLDRAFWGRRFFNSAAAVALHKDIVVT